MVVSVESPEPIQRLLTIAAVMVTVVVVTAVLTAIAVLFFVKHR